jgi:hypothetical protein
MEERKKKLIHIKNRVKVKRSVCFLILCNHFISIKNNEKNIYIYYGESFVISHTQTQTHTQDYIKRTETNPTHI